MSIFRIIWLILAAANLSIQILYFYRDSSSSLFRAKKITTPALLFGGLLIVISETGGFQPISCSILLAMGLGEIGIEGSSVVEKHDGETGGAGGSIIVLLAAVLFLLVNIFLGIMLLLQNNFVRLPVSIGFAVVIIALMLSVCIRTFTPEPGLRSQMILYSAGLVVLLTGVLSDTAGDLSRLGLAGLILTVSDSLVLIRMAAGFDKQSRAGFRTLLAFLVVILLLYYTYMWVLIY